MADGLVITRYQPRPRPELALLLQVLALMHLLLTLVWIAPTKDWMEASTADFVEESSAKPPWRCAAESVDEVDQPYMMRELRYEGELFLLFEEARGGL